MAASWKGSKFSHRWALEMRPILPEVESQRHTVVISTVTRSTHASVIYVGNAFVISVRLGVYQTKELYCISFGNDMLRDARVNMTVAFRAKRIPLARRLIIADLWCEIVVHGSLTKIVRDQ